MKDDKVFTMALTWIIGGGAALWICYMIGIAFGVTRAEAPAWVQAIGSIGAIITAFIVAYHHNVVARRERIEQVRADEIRKIGIAKGLFNAVFTITDGLQSEFDKTYELTNNGSAEAQAAIERVNLTYFSDMKDAIAVLPIWEMPDHQMATHIAFTLRRIENFIERTENAKDEIFKYENNIKFFYHPDMESIRDSAINHSVISFWDLHDILDAAIKHCDKLLADRK